MANSSVCETVGIGSVKFRTHYGIFCTLNDVRHVPLMTKNLISLSMLDKRVSVLKVKVEFHMSARVVMWF